MINSASCAGARGMHPAANKANAAELLPARKKKRWPDPLGGSDHRS